MKPYQINLINAFVLLIIGLWGYLLPEAQRSFALIPVAFGVLFLGTTPLFKSGNRIIAYMVSSLTLLLMLALAGFLIEAMTVRKPGDVLRFGLMALSCIVATLVYLRAYFSRRVSS